MHIVERTAVQIDSYKLAGMAAAAWRGAWRSRKRVGGGDGDPVLPIRHPSLVDQHGFNYGSSTTASGTTLSNTTTYSSSTGGAGRALSSATLPLPPHIAAVVGAEGVGGHERVVVTEQEKAATREHIRDLLLVDGWRGAAATSDDATASSSSFSAQLDRWLSELRVSWVLHLADINGASAQTAFVSRRLQYTARSWTLALHVISRCAVSFTGWCSSSQQVQEEEEPGYYWPPASEFVGFVAATLLQMLPFVDAVVALDIVNPSSDGDDYDDDDHYHHHQTTAVASAHKFQTLIDVRAALSEASEHVQLWHLWLRSSSLDAEATAIGGELSILLLEKLDKIDEAILCTRDHIRTQFLSLMQDDDHRGSSCPSPGIHRATRSVISYIIMVSSSSCSICNRSSVDPAAHAVVQASPLGNNKDGGDENKSTSSCTHMIMAMIMSLEEKLTRVSLQSFADQSLRLLFLVNNLYFVWHQLRTNRLLVVPTHALTRKIDGYINSYLHVSWTPVLQPLLHNSRQAPSCCFFIGHYSGERRFWMEFDKTYTAQKLWKVPDPELREELRAAIIRTVVPDFTRFLEGSSNGTASSSRVTPEKLEEMLEELFEG